MVNRFQNEWSTVLTEWSTCSDCGQQVQTEWLICSDRMVNRFRLNSQQVQTSDQQVLTEWSTGSD